MKVPSLSHKDVHLVQSRAIANYLARVHNLYGSSVEAFVAPIQTSQLFVYLLHRLFIYLFIHLFIYLLAHCVYSPVDEYQS